MKKILLFILLSAIGYAQVTNPVFTKNQRDTIRTMVGYINVKSYHAVGDSITDDTQAFQNAINAGDKVFVPEGVYTVDSLVLKSNTEFIGTGYGSKICLKSGGTVLFDIVGGVGTYAWEVSLSGVKISNLWLSGLDPSEIAGGYPSLGNRVGIHIDNAKDIYIKDCKITGFNSAGIVSEKTESTPTYTFNVNVSDCKIESNYRGIWIKEYSEYGFYNNNLIQGYYEGVKLIGGNNTFSNNQILNGIIGVHMEMGGNDSHGSFTGGSINHNIWAILADSVRTSENFTGMNIWYGKIDFNYSRAIRIMNSTVMTDTILFRNGDCANSGFINCTFRDDNVYISRDKAVDQSIMKNNNFFGTLLGIDDILINDINIEPYEPNISGLPSMVFNKKDSSYIAIGNNSNINFGDKDFTIEWFGYLKPDSTYQYLIDKSSIYYVGYQLAISSINTIQFQVYGEDANVTTGDSPTITEGYYHIVATKEGTNLAFYINGDSLDEYARPLLTENPVYNYYSGASTSNTDDLILGRYKYPIISPSGYYDGEMNLVRFYNFAVLGTQARNMFTTGLPNLSEVPYKYKWGSQDTLTSGTLELGKTYIIDDYVSGDDFTNVGGTNADSSIFVATGTTPTTWTNSSVLRKLGCVAEYRAENSNTSTWFDNSTNNLDGTNYNIQINKTTPTLPNTAGITAGFVPKVQSDGSIAYAADAGGAGSDSASYFSKGGLWHPTDSLLTIAELAATYAPISHSHSIGNVTALQDSLTAKANTTWFAISPTLIDDSITVKMNRSEMTGYATASHSHIDFFDTLTVSWGVLDTTYAGSLSGWKVPNDITITEISAYTDANTCTFNLEERGETTPNTAGTDVMSSDLVADTDQQETTTFSNANIAKNAWLVPTISATGDVSIFSITVRYIKTD